MECSIEVDVEEYVEDVEISMLEAGKLKTCGECGSKIQVGDIYEYVSGRFDGEPYMFITCAPCSEIRKAVFCGSWYYGRMWEDIEESGFKLALEHLANFSSKSQRKLIEKLILDNWDFLEPWDEDQ